MTAPIELTPVKSSIIAAIGYDNALLELHVKFVDRTTKDGLAVPGATYIYSNVTPDQHAAFVGAEGISAHFHAHIRDKHDSKRMDRK